MCIVSKWLDNQICFYTVANMAAAMLLKQEETKFASTRSTVRRTETVL